MRIIYDVGANIGDNLPYYLLKADKVVAIEANPVLADHMRARFRKEMEAGRVIVEAVVVTSEDEQDHVPFYVNRDISTLSQRGEPSTEEARWFDRLDLPCRRLVDIIAEHGDPHYVKVDVEGCDHQLLDDLFNEGIFPPYLSAESQVIEVFATLVANGRYPSFKIVDGARVEHVYENHRIETAHGPLVYSFPPHSAGPFGNDVSGQWQTPATFLHTLARHGLGWKDIHVSRLDEPSS